MAETINQGQKKMDVHTPGFLTGGGEMGERMRAYDWSETTLGPVSTWPQSLRTTLSIMLHARFPMFLWWGEELIQFYNDAYRPSLGHEGKHPTALGQRGEDCWPEIWTTIKPLIDQVRTGGEATWSEDQLIPIYRNGKIEDVYWTFSYSPVYNESGKVGGVLVVCNETTKKVKTIRNLRLSDQRFQNLVREASVGIIVLTGQEMRVEIVNETYGRLIDRTPEALLHKPLFSVIPEAEEAFRPILDKVRLTGEPLYLYNHPYFVYVNGEKKEGYLNLVYQPYKETDGTITGVIVLCQDVTPQVVAQKSREESEARFRSLIEESPVATCLFVGRNMVIEVANESMIQFWGKGTSVMGKPLREALPELEGQPFLQILDEVFTTGKTYEAKNAAATLVVDGLPGTYYFDFTYTPLFNIAGEVYGVMDTGVNVTQQVLAQKQLEESALNLRNIILQAPVAMCILKGPQHVTEIANDLMYELWGKTPEAMLGKPLLVGLPEVIGQGFDALLDNVYHTGETYKASEIPVILPRQSGLETVYVDFVYEALREGDGSISGVMVVATTVTEQVNVRRKIEESEEKYRSLFETMDQGFCIIEMIFDSENKPVDYRFLEYNPVFEKQTGLKEAAGKTALELVPNLEAHWFEIYGKVALTGEPTRFIEGSEAMGRWFEVYAFRLGGNLSRKVSLLFSDITERKQAEGVLEQKNAQLLRINNDLDNFIYTASHDLKAPISNIESLLHALLRVLPPESLASERTQRITGMMQESVERFKKTIANLTEVVKLQKEHSGEAILVDLSEVIREVRQDLEPMIHTAHAQLEVEVADCPAIRFSEKNMRSVVYNLLSNAIKYRSPDRIPQVRIRCESTPEYHLLTVADNGLGIEAGRLGQLFTMFKRFHAHIEGTGIGLYMIRKMVDNAGGRIEVESQVNIGTTFRVYFPC